MAVTMLCSILPSVIFAPLSGVICDYFNRKKVIFIADSVAAINFSKGIDIINDLFCDLQFPPQCFRFLDGTAGIISGQQC